MDFVARQKAQGTHLNWYIAEQLPVIAPDDYNRPFGRYRTRDLILAYMNALAVGGYGDGGACLPTCFAAYLPSRSRRRQGRQGGVNEGGWLCSRFRRHRYDYMGIKSLSASWNVLRDGEFDPASRNPKP